MQRYCNGHANMKIILCKLNFMFFVNKSEKQEKEADTNFLFSQSRNMIRRFVKANLHRPMKILQFLTLGRIQNCST